jgi:hypothetical protein
MQETVEEALTRIVGISARVSCAAKCAPMAPPPMMT